MNYDRPGPGAEPEGERAHYVNPEAFNPVSVEALSPEQERYFQASQWKIMWWKFRRHKVAVWSAWILLIFYLCVPFAEIIAPYEPNSRSANNLYAPPQVVRFFHEGSFVGPFVYEHKSTLNLEKFRREFSEDRTKVSPIRFFCSGDTYKFWGMWEGTFHLICPAKNGTLFLAGTDRLGRDLLSGLIYGARVSLTVGLIGVAISMVFGIVLGGIAGYFGGFVDAVI